MNKFIKNIKEKQASFNQNYIDLNFRIAALKKLKEGIIANEELIFEGLKKDLNKSNKETFICEINEALFEIDYHLKKIKTWVKPKKVKNTLQTFNTHSYIVHKPKGRVLIISPFNYPINLTFIPLIGAISAGNQVLIKNSNSTKYTNEAIKKIINDCFNENYIAYLDTKDLHNYDELYEYEPQMIFFTGSSYVGKQIESECVKRNISYVTELGGQCPCIVDDLQDEIIYDRLVWAKFLNAGQTCVSINHLFYNENIISFIDKLIESIKKQFPEPLKNLNMVKLIDKKAFDRLTKIIDENTKNILFGGKYDNETLMIEPTIIKSNVEKIKEYGEIFGPILFVKTFKNNEFDETLNLMNEINDSPLAAYLISNNKNKICNFFRKINAGSYCVNDAITQILNHHLPFGGVYNSGSGQYHGYFSFEAMSWKKPILVNKNKKDFPIKYINNSFDLYKSKRVLKILSKFKH